MYTWITSKSKFTVLVMVFVRTLIYCNLDC